MLCSPKSGPRCLSLKQGLHIAARRRAVEGAWKMRAAGETAYRNLCYALSCACGHANKRVGRIWIGTSRSVQGPPEEKASASPVKFACGVGAGLQPIWYREPKGVFASLGCPFPSNTRPTRTVSNSTGKMMTGCACIEHLERKTVSCYPSIAITFHSYSAQRALPATLPHAGLKARLAASR